MKRILFLLFSLIVTIAVFAYLFSKVSLGDVLDLARNADRRGLAMFLVMSLTMSLFRTWRFALLLGSTGYRPSRLALYLVVLVRNLFADLLPARLGTLVYIFLVTTRLGIPGGAATSSFSLAFVFDFVVLAPLILLAAAVAAGGAFGSPVALVSMAVVVGLGSVAVLALLPMGFRWACAILNWATFLPEAPRKMLQKTFDEAGVDVRTARAEGLYGPLLWLSLMVRITKYGALYFFLYALLQPLGYGLSQLSIARSFLGICASEVVASLPVSGIAGFGAYEGTWLVVFQLLGFPERIAEVTSVSHHLFTQVYGYGLGAAALAVLMLPIFRAGSAEPEEPVRLRACSFYPRMAGTIGVVSLLLVLCYRAIPAQAGAVAHEADTPTAEDVAQRAALAADFPGRILFDSNRSGTFGIYTIRADGTDVQTVCDTDEQEVYPDPSPDGRFVVFARAVTTARRAPSDIWICRADGSEPRQLAADGTFPTFSHDGKTVYFERQRKQVMAVPVDRGDPALLFEPAEGQLVKPRVSPDGARVAYISDQPRPWHVRIAALETGKETLVGEGCEPAWLHDGNGLVWLKTKDAKERSGVYLFRAGSVTALQDADAPRGHEYFPGVSPDGRYLLWSACRPEEHSHISANYQIFLRDLRGVGEARITFDAYNNRWPKIQSAPAP